MFEHAPKIISPEQAHVRSWSRWQAVALTAWFVPCHIYLEIADLRGFDSSTTMQSLAALGFVVAAIAPAAWGGAHARAAPFSSGMKIAAQGAAWGAMVGMVGASTWIFNHFHPDQSDSSGVGIMIGFIMGAALALSPVAGLFAAAGHSLLSRRRTPAAPPPPRKEIPAGPHPP